jgi:hypothetical protein
MSDNKYARVVLFFFKKFDDIAEQTCKVHTCKQVIQASPASSHIVGKCIVEPSKQLRVRSVAGRL